MIQQISEGLLYSLAQHFIGGSAAATSAAAAASGPPAGVGCRLPLPTSTEAGEKWWAGHRIALGHVTYAPVKKTEFLSVLVIFAALSDLIWPSEVWNAGASAARGKKRTANDRSTKSAKKYKAAADIIGCFFFAFIIISSNSVWESTILRTAYIILHLLTVDVCIHEVTCLRT